MICLRRVIERRVVFVGGPQHHHHVALSFAGIQSGKQVFVSHVANLAGGSKKQNRTLVPIHAGGNQ